MKQFGAVCEIFRLSSRIKGLAPQRLIGVATLPLQFDTRHCFDVRLRTPKPVASDARHL
jgi:hypothetical protein